MLCAKLAAEGARVFVGYRARSHRAEEVVSQIQAAGGIAQAVLLDVTEPDSITQAVGIWAEHGPNLRLVNNAGITHAARFGFDDPTAFADVMQVNLIGAASLLRACVRPMLQVGGGSVVNVGSIGGLRAMPGSAAYSASKGGLIALTRTVSAELMPKGIRVNAVIPGVLDLGMANRMAPQLRDAWLAHLPAGRTGSGEEVAEAVSWLLSEAASYVVGHALVVDGGLSL